MEGQTLHQLFMCVSFAIYDYNASNVWKRIIMKWGIYIQYLRWILQVLDRVAKLSETSNDFKVQKPRRCREKIVKLRKIILPFIRYVLKLELNNYTSVIY